MFVASSTFQTLWVHTFECAIDDNHVVSLIKLVSKMYAKIRLFHQGKVANDSLTNRKKDLEET